MKLKLFILPLLMLFCASCNDMLNKEPLEMYEGDFVLTTQEGMDLLLNGTYDVMSGSKYYGALLYLYEASKGSDFFVRNVSGGSSFYYENRYGESKTYNSNAKSAWLTIYLAIRNATILLENIDNVEGGDPIEMRRIKGEAMALRALCYFDLMRLFAYPPIFSCTWGTNYDEQFKWGVPMLKDVEQGTNILDYEIRRETADKVYNFIVDEFTQAIPMLEDATTAQGHINAAAVQGLLMRAKLYMQKWDDVITIGEDWITKYGMNYSMIPYDSYTTTYYKAFNSERIWEFVYTTDDNLSASSLNHWVRHPTYNEPGSPRDGKVSDNIGYAKLCLMYGDEAEEKNANMYGLNFLTHYPNDVRQYLICEMNIESNFSWRGIRRYVGDPFHSVHNVPVIRLPEIYLSLAEAYIQNGDKVNATEYASKVSRVRRLAEASISSATNVLNERRREYYLEGQNYWDSFRTNRTLYRQIIESSDDASIKFGSPSGAGYRVVYPIPLAEMNANPAIRDQQNPGYGAWEFAIEE